MSEGFNDRTNESQDGAMQSNPLTNDHSLVENSIMI